MSKPDVPNCTVIIPVHEDDRDSEWLKQAIASFPNGTPYIVAVNTGDVGEAVNDAARAATTRWISVFGHDDTAGPNYLEHMLGIAFAAQVVYPAVQDVNADMTGIVDQIAAPPFCPHRLLMEDYLPYQSLVDREAFLGVGGWRSEAAPLEGWDMFVRGWRAGWRFKPVQAAWFNRRLREESRTVQPYDRKRLHDLVVGEMPDYKATFYYQATHACSYLRCILPARYLPGVARPDLYARVKPKDGLEEALTADDVEDVEFPFHMGDAAVLQFAGDSTWGLLMHALQEQGRSVLVEVDDNYLHDPGKVIRGKSNWGARIGEGIHTYEGHRNIVKWADGVIVTTEQLASSYRKWNPNVMVIPNPVDPVDWAHVERPDDGVFRIGWFASASHYADIKLVTRAMEWASRQPGVEIVTMGIDTGWKFAKRMPWFDDLDVYRAMLGTLDVGVCPVIPSPFSIFRSDVKASEITMGGAAVICSDVSPYRDWQHGETCLKAGSAKDFFHHVKHLVANRDEARALNAEARKWVDEHRHIRRLVPLWEEALQVKRDWATELAAA